MLAGDMHDSEGAGGEQGPHDTTDERFSFSDLTPIAEEPLREAPQGLTDGAMAPIANPLFLSPPAPMAIPSIPLQADGEPTTIQAPSTARPRTRSQALVASLGSTFDCCKHQDGSNEYDTSSADSTGDLMNENNIALKPMVLSCFF